MALPTITWIELHPNGVLEHTGVIESPKFGEHFTVTPLGADEPVLVHPSTISSIEFPHETDDQEVAQ